jgi:AcrR family transcriptional regulator
MVRAAKTRVRKKPTQERAQETVDAILAATARVVARDGYDRASTNRIAEAAGVSIGSLYQYFPSKEAIVSALMEGHMSRMLAVLSAAYEQSTATRSIEEAARAIIEAVFAAHRVNPKLHRILLEQVPRIGTLDRIDSFEEQTQAMVESFLAARASELRRENIKIAARVVVLAVRGVTLWSVMRAPDDLANPAFLEEVIDLVVRYLVAA